ncbi:MAG TPA: hypothetical protein VJU13_02265 [Candidatus Nitrosocosmicus sp.]|jgi:hypothetical protein|nr:hypothetical protein [Candidatus Nitrosocosmicus sp.]
MSAINHQQSFSSSLLNENEEKEAEDNLITYICENTDGILDSIDQMTFALNETAIKYGPVVVLKDAP